MARSLYEKIAALDAQRSVPDHESGSPRRVPDLVGLHIALPSVVFKTRPKYIDLHECLADRRAGVLERAHPFYPINLDIKGYLLEERGRLEKLGYPTDAKRCYQQASQLYEEALELRKKHLGVAHRDTLVSLDHLGSFYLGDPFHPEWIYQPEKTLQLWTEAWRLRSASLGEKHPETLRSLDNLAYILLDPQRLNRPAEGLPLLEKAYRYRAETLGASNWVTIG